MLFQYNRLILSTCVSVMTLAFCMPAPAYAGFEWTPPENSNEQQPDVMPPGSALPLPPAEVEEQMLQSPPMMPEPSMRADKPVMKVKVLDNAQTTPPPIESAQQHNISRKNIVPTPVPQEQPITPKQANITPIPPTGSAPVPPKSTGLSIDPYPKANAQQKSAEMPVVLPSNPDANMSDVALQQTGQKPQIAPQPNQEPIKWNNGVNFTVVEGFGTDIPLALALSQIVPPEYAYSFGDGVNPGQRVSWTGGKPWNEVLSDVLAPLNVVSEIKGKKLVLKSLAKQANLDMDKTPDAEISAKKKQLS